MYAHNFIYTWCCISYTLSSIFSPLFSEYSMEITENNNEEIIVIAVPGTTYKFSPHFCIDGNLLMNIAYREVKWNIMNMMSVSRVIWIQVYTTNNNNYIICCL